MVSRQSESDESSARLASRLSALVDGEASEAECTALLQAWRQDTRTRSDWQLYHLIGDVMRSDDLAQSPAEGARFAAAVTARLAAEPVVLAPAPVAAAVVSRSVARSRRRLWSGSAAVAAGVFSVVGVTVMLRGTDNAAAPQQMAQAQAAPVAVAAPVVRANVGLRTDAVALVRDPELDRYLQAHRQQVRGLGLASPEGLRQVVDQPLGR